MIIYSQLVIAILSTNHLIKFYLQITNNNRIYRCRFDHPDIAISKELAQNIGKAEYVHELIRHDFNMIADSEQVLE